jgi:hypothetical protein
MRRASGEVSAGVDSSVIMQLSGWRTDSVFRRYAIVAADDKLDACANKKRTSSV